MVRIYRAVLSEMYRLLVWVLPTVAAQLWKCHKFKLTVPFLATVKSVFPETISFATKQGVAIHHLVLNTLINQETSPQVGAPFVDATCFYVIMKTLPVVSVSVCP